MPAVANVILAQVVPPEPPIGRLDQGVEGEGTGPDLDWVDCQSHRGQGRVLSFLELAPEPFLQQVEPRIHDLAVLCGDLVWLWDFGVVHGPIEPPLEIPALDVGPRDLAEPSPEAVPEIDSSGVVALELDDFFLWRPGALSEERLVVPAIFRQVGHSSFKHALEGDLDLCNVGRCEWRESSYMGRQAMVVETEEELKSS